MAIITNDLELAAHNLIVRLRELNEYCERAETPHISHDPWPAQRILQMTEEFIEEAKISAPDHWSGALHLVFDPPLRGRQTTTNDDHRKNDPMAGLRSAQITAPQIPDKPIEYTTEECTTPEDGD